jgi:DNA-binding transcriptional LysR family regulator
LFGLRLYPGFMVFRVMNNLVEKVVADHAADGRSDRQPHGRKGMSGVDDGVRAGLVATAVRAVGKLNLRQLEVFNAIVLSGSITAAARLLHISQPGISRSLSNLERDVGFALFIRDKKRIVITPEGLRFYEEVRRSYFGLDRLAQAAQEIRELGRVHLRIASMPALSCGMVPHAIKMFLEQNPALKLSFEAHMSHHVIDSVANQRVDIGIAQVAPEYPGLKIHSSFRSDCVCVVPIGHPYRDKEFIELADLQDQPFVALPQHTIGERPFNDVFMVTPKIETLGTSTACAMVAEGIGIAIVDPFSASFAGARLIQKPFLPTIDFDFCLVYPDNRVMSGAARLLLEHFADAFERYPLVREHGRSRTFARGRQVS